MSKALNVNPVQIHRPTPLFALHPPWIPTISHGPGMSRLSGGPGSERSDEQSHGLQTITWRSRWRRFRRGSGLALDGLLGFNLWRFQYQIQCAKALRHFAKSSQIAHMLFPVLSEKRQFGPSESMISMISTISMYMNYI